uniref:Protein kinase domain-containing protein n=1 Tax=Acrobeloides nanus TaxID=290746 RepID=A0A914C3U7_9BILA
MATTNVGNSKWIPGKWDDIECHRILPGICQIKVAGMKEFSSKIPNRPVNNKWIISIVLIAIVAIVISMILWTFCRQRKIPKRQENFIPMDMVPSRSKVRSGPNMSKLRLIKMNELIIDEKQKLGEGEFGAVYAAKYILTELNNKKLPVAVKVINKKKEVNPKLFKKWTLDVVYFTRRVIKMAQGQRTRRTIIA